MKRITGLVWGVMMVLSLTLSGTAHAAVVQNADLAEQCESINGVNIVSINQAMLRLASFPDKGSNPIDLDAISSMLDKVQIINADEAMASTSVLTRVNEYLHGSPSFERTMKMKDGDESVQMYMRKLPDEKNEYIMIIEDSPDVTIVVLLGRVTMAQLASVTDF